MLPQLNIILIVSDQGSLNFLGPGLCSSKQSMHVWGEGGSPPRAADPDSHLSDTRDSEVMKATLRRATSTHAGCSASGSDYQQSEHVFY